MEEQDASANLNVIYTVREKLQRHLTLRTVFLAGAIIRGALLVYGEWQDFNFTVQFTDIDYHVFTDASKHVLEGKSPFSRPTYRYTPLLAILLTLNHLLFYSFGKVLFVCCDMCVALLIQQILAMRGVGKSKRVFSVSLWLLNPLTATVSSRGNAESILAVLVLLTLYLIMCKRLHLSAIVLGLAIHMKIFPVIYSLPLFLFIDDNYIEDTNTDLGASPVEVRPALERFFSPWRVKYVVATVATFFVITAAMYLLYGDEFIQEAYLYHVTRRDTRHNFSVYFYMLYLIQDSWLSLPVGVLSFGPQAILLLVTSVWLFRDIALCCFVQTFIFVTFNKVCTSQYFMWYLCLLPLVTAYSKLTLSDTLRITTLWFIGQALWLLPAYFLEFQGYNTFVLIWLAGVVFFLINVYILTKFLSCQTVTPVFVKGRILSIMKHNSKMK